LRLEEADNPSAVCDPPKTGGVDNQSTQSTVDGYGTLPDHLAERTKQQA
jgi:hypothetical protein